jgi:hypothetical protein
MRLVFVQYVRVYKEIGRYIGKMASFIKTYTRQVCVVHGC